MSGEGFDVPSGSRGRGRKCDRLHRFLPSGWCADDRVAGDDVHVLEVGAVVADWFQAEAHELCGDVVGRDVIFGAGDVATGEVVGGEEVEVCLEVCGLD